MIRSHLLMVAAFAGAFLLSCEPESGPVNLPVEQPVIERLEVFPSSVDFTAEDLSRPDSLIAFELRVRSNLPESYRLVAYLLVTADRSVLDSDTLIADSSRPGLWHEGSLEATLPTSARMNLVVYVSVIGKNGKVGNRSEATIPVRSAPSGHPLVFEVNHPDTVFIPQPGFQTTFFISARVGHTIADELVDRVYLELFDQSFRRIYGPSAMEDENNDFGNKPGDGVFVDGFTIGPDNQPDRITVGIHAIDLAGTRSDTLRSQFVIVP